MAKPNDRDTPSFIQVLQDIRDASSAQRTSVIKVANITGGSPAVRAFENNANAKVRTLYNTGTGMLYFGFGSAVNDTSGMLIPAGAAWEWDTTTMDTRAIWVYSPGGTTIRVLEAI